MKKVNKKLVEMATSIENLATMICGHGSFAYHNDDRNYPIRKEAVLEYLEMGAKFVEQQMLKDAMDAVVKIDAGGYPYVDATIELYDYDKDIPLAKEGDKVKILVIRKV